MVRYYCMSTRRVQKVSELILQQLSFLIRENTADELGMISVTAVNVNDDLKEARVYISCLDQSKEKEALKVLEAKTPEFQHILGKRLSMKFTPKLKFLLDRASQKVDRIEELLGEIQK
jgi:ribosome-binding factor A